MAECVPGTFGITDGKHCYYSITLRHLPEVDPSHAYTFVVLSEAKLACIEDSDIRAPIHRDASSSRNVKPGQRARPEERVGMDTLPADWDAFRVMLVHPSAGGRAFKKVAVGV